MSDIIIRRVQGEEMLEKFFPMPGFAFGPSPRAPRDIEALRERLPNFEQNTVLMVFEDDKPQTAIASAPMTQNVRGKIYPMGAVWGVVTYPEGRRKGYVRQTLKKLFVDMREEGNAFTGLYPFRPSFYERMGYVNFPYMKIVSFPPQNLRPIFDWNLEGQVEQMMIADGYDIYRQFTRKHQQSTHGMALAPDPMAEDTLKRPNNLWLAVARHDDQVVGLMMFNITNFRGTMDIPVFLYNNNHGKYLLLEWLARYTDQVYHADLHLAAAEFPETWLADAGVRMQFKMTPMNWDGMGRVLDIMRIGGMQSGVGRFTAKINDHYCPWNNGTFAFETVNGHLQVSETASADCDLTINGISALIYGTHDPDDFAFRGWGNPSPQLQQTMRTMFPRMMPYMFELY
jgi:predicted acetyltransferase